MSSKVSIAELVCKLISDGYLIKNLEMFSDIFDTPAADWISLHNQYKNGTLGAYAIVKEVIQIWMSRNSKKCLDKNTIKDISEILRGFNLNSAAHAVDLLCVDLANTLSTEAEASFEIQQSRAKVKDEIAGGISTLSLSEPAITPRAPGHISNIGVQYAKSFDYRKPKLQAVDPLKSIASTSTKRPALALESIKQIQKIPAPEPAHESIPIKSTRKTEVAIIFGKYEVSAYSFDRTEPRLMFGPVEKRDSFWFGTEIDYVPRLNYLLFLTLIDSLFGPETDTVEKVALILIKLNDILCSKLKSPDLTLLVIFPSCCIRLANIFNSVSDITGLDIIPYEISEIIFMHVLQKVNYESILIVCDYSNVNSTYVLLSHFKKTRNGYILESVESEEEGWFGLGIDYGKLLSKTENVSTESLKVTITTNWPERSQDISKYVTKTFNAPEMQIFDLESNFNPLLITLIKIRKSTESLTEISLLNSKKHRTAFSHSKMQFDYGKISRLRQGIENQKPLCWHRASNVKVHLV